MIGLAEKSKKAPCCVGLLAHVDAGKTTLSEAMLYVSGAIRTLGRVDHRDAHLDTHELERRRGITIFSKMARLTAGQTEITLLDTPGHVDFSAETERTLQVLDYAILVISATDGVQAHTETLWGLLRRYRIPTFLFISKMDLPNAGRAALLSELRSRLSEDCADALDEGFAEEAAVRDEALLARFLENGTLSDGEIAALIRERKLFPCYFGSALRLEGVDALLSGLDRYTVTPDDSGLFGARVYKILRDAQGNRLTCMKLTGGSLRVRDPVSGVSANGTAFSEKATQLRLYSGEKYETAQEVGAGAVCAVLGLNETFVGQGLGAEGATAAPLLEPVMTYSLQLPPDCDPRALFPKLRQLEEEDPQLHLVWEPKHAEIRLQLMGEVQTEVIQALIRERFDTEVRIGSGSILYRETIRTAAEGVGHFEPLRHYAEVHLLLEPLPRGSGVQIASACPEDVLDRSWQRLILTHLQEKTHLGVLTGAPVTDLRLTLASGRAHIKHTEGGDFRQAAYRAVRQGLMRAESVLLEPLYAFRLELPQAQVGRAIQELRLRHAELREPETRGENAVLEGTAPVACLRGYEAEVAAYTHGRGRLSCTLSGYAPCHDQARVVAETGYDPEADLENTPDSVFCAHGAGFPVKWNRVPEYMHLESALKKPDAPQRVRSISKIEERELEAILEREFGPISRRQYRSPAASSVSEKRTLPAPPKRTVIIVDGYNVIFAWDGLKELAQSDLEGARLRLMDLLSNYAAFTGCELILVFDAYRVRDGRGERGDYLRLHVVYTQENETADRYIERLLHEIGKNDAVRIVTSDAMIQVSALRAGVLRMSAAEFEREVGRVGQQIAALVAREEG